MKKEGNRSHQESPKPLILFQDQWNTYRKPFLSGKTATRTLSEQTECLAGDNKHGPDGRAIWWCSQPRTDAKVSLARKHGLRLKRIGPTSGSVGWDMILSPCFLFQMHGLRMRIQLNSRRNAGGHSAYNCTWGTPASHHSGGWSRIGSSRLLVLQVRPCFV